MLPPSYTGVTLSVGSNSDKKHLPSDDIDQVASVLERAQYVEHLLSDREKERVYPSAQISESKWANGPVTDSSYAESLSSALHSSQSKEAWRSIAFEAVKKSSKGKKASSLPMNAAASVHTGEEEADSSEVLSVWRGAPGAETTTISATDLLDSSVQTSTPLSDMDAAPSRVVQPTLLSAESVEKASAERATMVSAGPTAFSHETPCLANLPAVPATQELSKDAVHLDEVLHSKHTARPATAADDSSPQSASSNAPTVRPAQGQSTEDAAQNGQLFSAAGLLKTPDQAMDAVVPDQAAAAPAPERATGAAAEGTAAAAGQCATSAVTDADAAAPAVALTAPASDGALHADSAAWGLGASRQQPVLALQPQQPLAFPNTGNPFARGLSRPCSPVNAFAAHGRSGSMPSFLFDDPRPSSAPPFATSPTAAQAAAAQQQAVPHQPAPDEVAVTNQPPVTNQASAPNQAVGGAWLYQMQPSPGVWLEGTCARPVDVILSEVGSAVALPRQQQQQQQPALALEVITGSSMIQVPVTSAAAATTTESSHPPELSSEKADTAAWDFSFPEAECAFPPQPSADSYASASLTADPDSSAQTQTQLKYLDLAFSTDIGAFSTDMGASAARQLPPEVGGSGARSGAEGSPAAPTGSPGGRGDFATKEAIMAPQPPQLGEPTWTEGTPGDFNLLLPKREAPPPPQPPPAVSAARSAWQAWLPGLSEGSEVACAVPGADDMAATWRPMRQVDKDSCRRAFHAKGHAKLGGVSREDAEMVHRKLGTAEPFEAVWALADWNASSRLSEPQFLLFMFLLKALRKGRPLPPRLGLTQARPWILFVSYLLGIPAEYLLAAGQPPAASAPLVPQLLPGPHSAPQSPDLLPHPAPFSPGNSPDPAAELGEMGGTGGNAAWLAGTRQPSDLILRLAAGTKAAQQPAPDQATPLGPSLNRPLQAGAAGARGRSPPLPLGSPSFWQPFGTGRAPDEAVGPAIKPRPASAPSPTPTRAAAAGLGAFGGGIPAPDKAAAAGGGTGPPGCAWGPFDGVAADGQARADAGTASDDEWQPFEGAPPTWDSDRLRGHGPGPTLDAWALENAHPPVYSLSLPASWGEPGARPPSRAASASAEGREPARMHNGAAARTNDGQGRPPSGQRHGRSQAADLLSTWPQRGSLREGIPSPRRASPAAPGSGGTTPRSLSPNSHPPSQQPPGHVSLYKQPTVRANSSAGGVRRLAITIERARLDYRKPLDRPVFCVSLHDADGRTVEAPQDTPPGHFDRGRRSVAAGHTVILRTPLRQMPPEAVVYVELKHWKSASRKMSVLGWSFAPIETLVDASSPPDDPAPRAGQLFLHLWRKPLDPTAHQRRIQLKALHPHEHDLFLSITSA